jgi:hypothetical protein
MEALLGFSLGFWDYATFLSLFVLVVAGLGLAVFILGLPGRIAIARNHSEAEAVYLMGWVGLRWCHGFRHWAGLSGRPR